MSPFTALVQFLIVSLVHYYKSLPTIPLPNSHHPNSPHSQSGLKSISGSVTLPLRCFMTRGRSLSSQIPRVWSLPVPPASHRTPSCSSYTLFLQNWATYHSQDMSCDLVPPSLVCALPSAVNDFSTFSPRWTPFSFTILVSQLNVVASNPAFPFGSLS